MFNFLLAATLAEKLAEKATESAVGNAVGKVVEEGTHHVIEKHPFSFVLLYQSLLFFLGGLAVGIVCRKYLKIVLSCMFIILIGVIFLEYTGLLVINWNNLFSLTEHALAEVKQSYNSEVFLSNFLTWARFNWGKIIVGVLGFILGYIPDDIINGVSNFYSSCKAMIKNIFS